MAIEFEKQKNRQKYLVGVAIVIVIATGIILWKGYFSEVEIEKKPSPQSPQEVKFSPESLPQINFNIFEESILKELNSYPTIEAIEREEVGRENPFLPYNNNEQDNNDQNNNEQDE